MKNDPTIKKIILTRSVHIEVEGANVVIVPLNSYEGQSYLLRARQVFLRHGVGVNIGYPLSSELHNFYNLWHGIPLKRIGYASLDEAANLKDVAAENKRLKSVIAASDVDRLAMATAYWPLTYHDVWVTGLPRHDFILASENDLPSDFLLRTEKLKSRLQGRKFLLFAPTFRANQANGYYSFSEEEVQQLTDWLTQHNFVMGIREHMADKARVYSSQLRGTCFFDASERHYPDIELLYRHTDMLLTDYSSCYIDFILTGRPVISFAFDRNSYANVERGLFYDQEMVFPGPICENFSELIKGLDLSTVPLTDVELTVYQKNIDFFHKYRDNNNSDRVVEKVKGTYKGSKYLWQIKSLRPRGASRTITFVCSPAHNITNRYRIFNIIEHLRDLGWRCRVVTEDKISPSNLQDADVMFICRIPLSETLRDLCETFQAQGRKVVFDLDDLLHDLDAFSQSEYFRNRPELSSDSSVLSIRTRQMIDSADLITVTTHALSESISDIGKPVEVVPNSISSALISKYTAPPKLLKSTDRVRICYLSGTATHSEDFSQCHPSLVKILKRHPQAELHIVGKLEVGEAACGMSGINAIRHDLMTYDQMHSFLAEMDINLAPLAPSTFNDCKSELKIFEAALHRVPTIASPSQSYANAIKNGRNGILARTPNDWEVSLERLIQDANLRKKMGLAAFEEIVPCFTAKRSARILAGAVNVLLRNDTPERAG